jgi:hypothetical protein
LLFTFTFQKATFDLLLPPMPSRKKAKGKARRAAKETKAAAEEEEEADEVQAALVANQGGSLEAQMQRLTIDDLLGKSGAQVQCRHGLELESHEEQLCIAFLEAFRVACIDERLIGSTHPLVAGMEATKVTFASVWKDVEKLKQVVSYCVAVGTQCILDEKENKARLMPLFAYFIEQHIAAVFFSQRTIQVCRIEELCSCDLHTLVSFFRKRIPCKCLDEKYKEVKFVKKMGSCSNPDCSLPGRKVERNKILLCAQCNQLPGYCSRACQKAHWKEHKKLCREIAVLKAEFDAKERPQQC